jgi:tRNA modification GTPase
VGDHATHRAGQGLKQTPEAGDFVTAPADTIAAIATPAGRGGIGIVRVTGPLASAIAAAVTGSAVPERRPVHRRFLDADAQPIDDGLALFFPGPRSFTGEDVLELQGHGGPVVLDLLLERSLELGARLARPGEFTERAYLNGKLDLAQAEAVADLIDAGSRQAARSAQRALQGEFSERIDTLMRRLTELRVYIEAALDFPDEELDLLRDGDVASRLAAIRALLDRTLAAAGQGVLLREGLHLVLAGQPNVGKSSLLNRLAGRDSAIVTELPGTTRDVLREAIDIDGLPLHVIDTAGLRRSADPIEREGIRRAWAEIERADLVLVLVDGTRGADADDRAILKRLPAELPRLIVHNKIDLGGHAFGELCGELYVSAKTGQGIPELIAWLKRFLGYRGDDQGVFIARRRHLEALQHAVRHLDQAERRLSEQTAPELVAEELRCAQDALGRIIGRLDADALLGEIFASFCIGK